jgi:phosphate transport system substrate-binding protein
MVFSRDLSHQALMFALGVLTLGVTGCGGSNTTQSPTSTPTSTGISGGTDAGSTKVLVDGSSTVFPISEAMAEEFQKANPNVKITVGVSGTGGGFKKFCAGETDMSNASRPIKQEEIELCQKNNIEYVELPIAYDGLSVVVNPANDWVKCLTVDELKKMWEPESQGKVKSWKDIRPSFPDEPLSLYGAGTDSGTFDYFTEAITGEKGKSRGDYTASEDDNTLVQGAAGSKGGLAYFGYAYYEQNQDKLKLVEVDGGKGCVAPNPTTIADGSYVPLSRPEFIYIKKTALSRPEVKAFAEFQINPANKKLISEVGYIPLPDPLYAAADIRLNKGVVGSVFAGKKAVGVKLADLMKAETTSGSSEKSSTPQ